MTKTELVTEILKITGYHRSVNPEIWMPISRLIDKYEKSDMPKSAEYINGEQMKENRIECVNLRAMEAKSKHVETPIGNYPFPMNPLFTETLKNCQTDEDLFKLVEPNGFINPDAFTEIQSRGLYFKYKEWKKNNDLLLNS